MTAPQRKNYSQQEIIAVMAYLGSGDKTVDEAAEKFGVQKQAIFTWMGQLQAKAKVRVNYRKIGGHKDWILIARELKRLGVVSEDDQMED